MFICSVAAVDCRAVVLEDGWPGCRRPPGRVPGGLAEARPVPGGREDIFLREGNDF